MLGSFFSFLLQNLCHQSVLKGEIRSCDMSLPVLSVLHGSMKLLNDFVVKFLTVLSRVGVIYFQIYFLFKRFFICWRVTKSSEFVKRNQCQTTFESRLHRRFQIFQKLIEHLVHLSHFNEFVFFLCADGRLTFYFLLKAKESKFLEN